MSLCVERGAKPVEVRGLEVLMPRPAGRQHGVAAPRPHRRPLPSPHTVMDSQPLKTAVYRGFCIPGVLDIYLF